MPTQDTSQLKEKIVFIIQRRGPSLPIHVAQATGLSMLFSSAFLSELISDKRIKISNMKVGGSPLYFIPGQEPLLERFSSYLKSKEREAFELLRSKKILRDKEQDPPIRVALRALKDFAFPVLHNEEIYWIYFVLPEQEAEEMLKGFGFEKEIISEKKEEIVLEKEEVIEEKIIEEIKPVISEIKPIISEIQEIKKDLITIPVEEKKEVILEKSVKKEAIKEKKNEDKESDKEIDLNILEDKPKEKEKIKEKSDFVKDLFKWMHRKGIEVLLEKESKKKEWLGIGKFHTDFGDFEIVIVAKDKKKISESDLKNSLEYLQLEKKVVFFLAPGSLDKKALEFLNKYGQLIKFIKL